MVSRSGQLRTSRLRTRPGATIGLRSTETTWLAKKALWLFTIIGALGACEPVVHLQCTNLKFHHASHSSRHRTGSDCFSESWYSYP